MLMGHAHKPTAVLAAPAEAMQLSVRYHRLRAQRAAEKAVLLLRRLVIIDGSLACTAAALGLSRLGLRLVLVDHSHVGARRDALRRGG